MEEENRKCIPSLNPPLFSGIPPTQEVFVIVRRIPGGRKHTKIACHMSLLGTMSTNTTQTSGNIRESSMGVVSCNVIVSCLRKGKLPK